MNRRIKKILAIIFVMLFTINCPMNTYAATNSGNLMTYALDSEGHPMIIMDASYEEFSEEYRQVVSNWTLLAFYSWAYENLKLPSSAVINEMEVALFSYGLLYPDMNEAYTGYINDLMINGKVSPEDLQSIGYVVKIDYSAQNSFGGYVRNTIYGVLTADGTGYHFGELDFSDNLVMLGRYSLYYSGNRIMRWRFFN